MTKLDRRNTSTSKKIEDNVVSAILGVIVIFGFMTNLEQLKSWIPDALNINILKLSLIPPILTRNGK